MKKLLFIIVSLLIGFVFAMSSCSSGSEQKTQKPVTVEQKEGGTTEAPAVNNTELASQIARGEQIYKEKCIVCHQANGKGLPGAFPPLALSDYLLADKVRAVAQALNGSNEPIKVNGQIFSAPMPPQVNTKEDAVAIINYVLNNFGNNGGYVTMEEVKDIVIKPRP